MPLSEEELRMLEQLERALVEDDPKLAHTMRGTTRSHLARRRLVWGAVGFLAGVVVLFAGAINAITWVGVVGFVIMLTSVMAILSGVRPPTQPDLRVVSDDPMGGLTSPGRGRSGRGESGGSARRTPRRNSASFMQRVEERWNRRRDQPPY